MHRLLLAALGILLIFTVQSCAGSDDGTTLSIQIDDAQNLTANLDRITIGGEKEMLKNTSIDSEGQFSFDFKQPLKEGLYQLRVGAQRATFALDEGDRDVRIEGELADISAYTLDIEGSQAASETMGAMRQVKEVKNLDEFRTMVSTIGDDHAAAYIVFNTMLRAGKEGLPLHTAAIERLPEDDPNRKSYSAVVDQLEQKFAFEESQRLIQPGQPAPDLSLQSPDGVTVSLSDLKGQVVLLDFWAAWCGPCRRENPNVVKVYDRYKDKGFTVYSVSLDGVGDNKASRLTPEQLEEARSIQRNKWVTAIEQDGLTWDNHVSELRHWSGEATAKYGVRAIPATFLIDREGKIAEVGLRGAASIEQALQRLL